MSIESVSRALDVSDVKGTVKLVLLGIANHDGDNGAWPSIATLARYAVCTPRRVQQCIAELEERGLVSVEANAGGTRNWREDRRPNMYRLHLDGVKPSSPRPPNGVKSEAERGEIQGSNGVKPVSPKPSIEPSEEPSTSLSPRQASALFEQWWECYRVTARLNDRPAGSKGDALRAWMKLTLQEKERAAKVIGCHQAHVQAEPERYVMPHGSTWLTHKRFHDETPLEPPRRQAKSHNGIDYLSQKLEEARRGS